MKKNNKKCIICGKAYTFCMNCGKFDHLPRWKAMFDRDKCREIFHIISDYQSNLFTKKETKDRLIKINAVNMSFTSPVQKIINKIMSEEESIVQAENGLNTDAESGLNTDTENSVNFKKKKSAAKK